MKEKLPPSKAHLTEYCPKSCLFDSSVPTEREGACGECYLNPDLPEHKRWMTMGDNIRIYIAADGNDKTWVDGKLFKSHGR